MMKVENEKAMSEIEVQVMKGPVKSIEITNVAETERELLQDGFFNDSDIFKLSEKSDETFESQIINLK